MPRLEPRLLHCWTVLFVFDPRYDIAYTAHGSSPQHTRPAARANTRPYLTVYSEPGGYDRVSYVCSENVSGQAEHASRFSRFLGGGNQ